MLHRLVRRFVACFMERGMRELVADSFAERRDVCDADGLRELIVERRKDFFGDLRRANAERSGHAREIALAGVVREREVHFLFLAHLHPDERLTQARDAEILPGLDVRVARERRQRRLPGDRRVDVDGEDVAGSRLSVHRPKLGVTVAHRSDGLVDLFFGGWARYDLRAVR